MNYTQEYFDTQPEVTPFEVGDHIDNKFLHATVISVRNRNGIGKGCVLKCDKCGYEFSRPYSQILKGTGCGVCSGRTLVKGMNDIPTTAPWMVKYFPGGEEEASNFTQNCAEKFIPICPYCGRVYDKPTTPNQLSRLHGLSCICKDGIRMPNKLIRNVMEQCKRLGLISYSEKEYRTYDRDNTERRFDMYFQTLEGKEYFVEMDGGLNHGEVIKKHTKKKFIPVKYFVTDDKKDEIAKKLNITLIRIDCYESDVEYIKKNMYESILSSLIDLDRIDWDEVELVCFSNVAKEVCQYKVDHPQAFAPEIAKIFDLSTTTIRTYLKRGTKLGLCNYNPETESIRRNSMKKHHYQSIPVIVKNLDTNEQWKFDSMAEITRQSESIFDGEIMTRKKLWYWLNKSNDRSFIYNSKKHQYLIKEVKEATNGVEETSSE